MWSIFCGVLLLAGGVLGQWNANFKNDRWGIVHLFEWHWATIADECETLLGPNKVGGVQISPPNENRIVGDRPWWERYQPISYILGTRSGNRDAFIDMVKRCNDAGVRIYPDVVINHMCGNGGSGTGTAGSEFNADKGNPYFPAVPFGKDDFNMDVCYTSSGEIENYGDATQVRDCMLVGLLDLKQGKEYVRGKIREFLNDLIDIGVAGFRIDACKHMWPGDLKSIYDGLHDLRTDVFGAGKKAYLFQEVIDQGGEPITVNEYTPMGAVTEFRYGINLANNKQSIQNLQTFGENWGMMAGTSALVFLNNHDNQRGHGGGGNLITFENPYDLKVFSAFMLAWPYGVPRVMSSYYFSDGDQGPPGSQRSVESDGGCGNGWVCEHRWLQIKNMFAFGAAVVGTGVENWWDNGNNQIAFSRGDRGFIAINKAGSNLDKSLYTGLPDGSYCNVIDGDFYDGKCAGECITVSNGNARIQISTSDDPVVAIHVNAMTTECGAGGGSSGGGGNTGGGGGSATSCTDCNCPDHEKVDCGELASTEASCVADGCLWCPLGRANVPWCFLKASDPVATTPPGGNGGENTVTVSHPTTSCVDCSCTNKIDCGELASTEASCIASGCLWCPLTNHSIDPWCFHVSDDVVVTTPSGGNGGGGATTPPTTTTSASGSGGCTDCSCTSKEDCGFIGTTEASCQASGCLWCPDNTGNDPWCFYGSSTGGGGGNDVGCAVQDHLKQDCGYMGIQQSECESNGCCWAESSGANVPWCYVKA